MNWNRSIDTAPAAESTSMENLADVYKRACGGVSCSGLQPTPNDLIAAARDKYVPFGQQQRSDRLEADINAYGANH